MASAISSDEREPAPSVSIAAVRLAMPYLPAGSSALPLSDDEVDLRDRHLVQLDDPDRQPFASCRFWMAGSFSAGAGPSAGGLLRSGACAASVAVPAATATSNATET